MANLDSSSVNPWSSNSTVLGLQLGDPQGGLVLARRHGLIPEQWQEVEFILFVYRTIIISLGLMPFTLLTHMLLGAISIESLYNKHDKHP